MGIYIESKQGSTLIESLFAFMIFTTCIIQFLSLFNLITRKHIDNKNNFTIIQDNRVIKEERLCIDSSILEIIDQVLAQ